jgi:dTDP-4-amino-4,6-dideoxy-D-galactose acyltransferase
MEGIKILDWDSDFLGYPVARIDSLKKGQKEWKKILAQLKIQGVKLAYWQVQPGNISFQKFAKENNGKLVDIKTTYSIHLAEYEYIADDSIENFENKEPNQQLLNLGIQCGAYSRFSFDKNIPRKKFEELYRLWIINSVKKSMADDVLVYKFQDRMVGLVTVYEKEKIGNIGLIGVDEEYRGRGIGKALLNAVKNYFYIKGIQKIHVVTQGQNQAACKLYESVGFNVLEQYEFYHFWLR